MMILVDIENTTVLVTGASGMIGRHLVKGLLEKGYSVIGLARRKTELGEEIKNYKQYVIDLADREVLENIFADNNITHIIHLAALAHTKDVIDLSEAAYRQANVINAQNVFEVTKDTNILFISTVDVFGFTKGVVSGETEVHPISIYGKTKAEAEEILKKQGGKFNIYRFSPVYTEEVKRDIQKRYYLKYPDWAYIVGKGSEYEVLNIKKAVQVMVNWVSTEPDGMIRVIKDEHRLETAKVIEHERKEGRAKHVLHFPRWMVVCGYVVARITGKNKYTYLLSKAVYPLRSE
ncbi:NAD-dependent epimerase/dehydratase family protein [Sedimentibacter saalensis]|uniref:NAD-dependent epimerase/dehydratase family protein n=1 Tax=Sedimentibacter saalensis TaxID=130788 RepID=A0A562J843_9FIRM|nr:NAD-dependent epimerase/dehydratase family protein [Sedimentibacter saalensis]